MLRTNVFPTYIPELDYKILEDTDDEDLFRSCNSNSYLASICDDEVFWRNRTITRYAMLIKFRGPGTTWKAFYSRLINDAMYLVHTEPSVISLHSNIKDAYKEFWDSVSLKNNVTVEEASSTDYSNVLEDMRAVIKIVYKGEISSVRDEIIFDNKRPTPDILQYPNLPGLKVRNRPLFFYEALRFYDILGTDGTYGGTAFDWDTENNDVLGVFDYNDEVLSLFMTWEPYKVNHPYYYSPDYGKIAIDSNKEPTLYIKYKYGYMGTNSGGVVLVNESLFGKPLKFVRRVLYIGDNLSREELIKAVESAVEKYYEQSEFVTIF